MLILKSMMLTSSTWQGTPTFRMIPVTTNTPYNEVIYSPSNNVLAIVSKEKKEQLKLVPRLDDNGDAQFLKTGNRSNGSTIKEERRVLEMYYEYFIGEAAEIENFVNTFAVNADIFDWKRFILPVEPLPENKTIENVDMKTLIMTP